MHVAHTAYTLRLEEMYTHHIMYILHVQTLTER